MTWNELKEIYSEMGDILPMPDHETPSKEYYRRLLLNLPREQRIYLVQKLFKDEHASLLSNPNIAQIVIGKLESVAFRECIEFLKGLEHG